MCNLSPSLLSANFYNLENDLNILYEENIKYIHLDVMDGVFVPNISMGIPIIASIKKNTQNKFILDTHLMIENPKKYIDSFKDAGSDIITFHREVGEEYLELIDYIKSKGIKAGISISPDTEVKSIIDALDKVDLVLIMSVHPGFGGQKFIENALDKIKYLKELKTKNNYNYLIEVDGGVYIENVKKVIDAGCDLIVSGSGVFKGNIRNNIREFKNLFRG